jgi:hypothetical protein
VNEFAAYRSRLITDPKLALPVELLMADALTEEVPPDAKLLPGYIGYGRERMMKWHFPI